MTNTTPDAVEAMQNVMAAYSPMEWLELKEYAIPENIIDRLFAQGFTITRHPAMSEAELDWQRDLETVMVSLKTIRDLGDYALTDGEIEVLIQRIDRVSEYFAKKYRGQS